MSDKPHLILWGGSWEPLSAPLTPETIDSHAKVSYVFLKEALSRYFEITGLDEFDKIASAELQENTIGVLSTFQAGFTQLKEKRPDMFKAIYPKLRGKMFSIIDETTSRRTCEDILFTVIKPDYSFKNRLQNFISPSKARYMGWCASPAYCYPEPSEKMFTIFLDHGHYAGSDYTHVFIEALASLEKEARFEVFLQGNNGVALWDFSMPWTDEIYKRANKVPWAEMMAHYRRADLFCLTHKESAGLSSIEAAMSGARLVVPHIKGDAFLHPALLAPPLDYVSTECEGEAVKACLQEQIAKGVDQARLHETMAKVSSWDQAAQRIYKALAGA